MKKDGSQDILYLDYQATTPMAPEVIAAMTEALPRFANPHSAHRPGRAAAAEVEVARDRVQGALDLPGGRFIFTSGATEALNIAISGIARRAPIERRRIVTIATEHAAVLDTVGETHHLGVEPVFLPVGRDGLVDLDIADLAIDERTALVAVMHVNNEIGVMQPLAELAAMAEAAGAPLLCDAVQGFGRVPLPVVPDMVAVSAHKIHGPKGIGGLWLRDGLDLPPLIHGGGQERGIRSGTLSPLLCTGFGVAAQLAAARTEADRAHVEALWSRAQTLFAGWTINGDADRRYRGNLNLRRPGVDGARLLSSARRVAFSLGSACASGSGRPSHVLRALGLTDGEARASIRLGFGRYTTMEELECAAAIIAEVASEQELLA